MDNLHICKYCGKSFDSGRALGSHYLHCNKNPNITEMIEKRANTKRERFGKHLMILYCKNCGKEYQLYISDREYKTGKYKTCCSTECSHQLSSKNRDLDTINKKKSATLKEYYKDKLKFYTCSTCGKQYTKSMHKSYEYCSLKCSNIGKHNKLSDAAKKRGIGGFVENSINNCKQGRYKGIKCDSSWELAFILWNEMQGKSIQRYKGYLTYIFEDKLCKYYPDFIIDDKIYEIKGYYSSRAKAKHEQHPEVILLGREEMIPIIEEVKEKYGNNFIELYD